MPDLEQEILFRVLRDDVDVVDGDFLTGFLTFQVLTLYVLYDEMIVEARSVVKQHWQEEVAALVALALVAGLLRILLRLELQVAVVAGCIQELTADVVVMTHLGVRGGEVFFAAFAVRKFSFCSFVSGSMSTCLLTISLMTLLSSRISSWDPGHCIRRGSLVLRVLRHSIHTEAGHLVVIYDLCIAFSLILCRWYKSFEQKRNFVLLVA